MESRYLIRYSMGSEYPRFNAAWQRLYALDAAADKDQLELGERHMAQLRARHE
jgi:hypothetical protein